MNQNNIPRGQLSIILLSTLLNGDKYGFEIINDIKEKTDNKMQIKQPTLYSSLTRMEKQGLISSYWRDGENGGKRHYYSLMDYGKKHLEQNESAFFTTISSVNNTKTDENRVAIAQNKKYDDIGDFQKKDDKLPIEKSDLHKNEQKIDETVNNKFYIQSEFSKLESNNPSFAENLKLEKNTINPSATENFLLKNIEADTFVVPNTQDEAIRITDILGLDKNIPTENRIFEKSEIDEGKLIQEKYTSEEMPKVKKIHATHLGEPDEKISQKLHPQNFESGYTSKINELYDKAKTVEEKKFDDQIFSAPTLDSLENRYKDMNVNFYKYSHKPDALKENVTQHSIIPISKIFNKYLSIFLIVLFETIVFASIFYSVNGSLNYSFAYFIVPILFAIIPIYYLISKKTSKICEENNKTFLYNILIFFVGAILLYALNMFLGITFENILSYETTFLYPLILLTNIIVSGIFDNNFIKKYSSK